jgi:AcrR family transcriptional regulator
VSKPRILSAARRCAQRFGLYRMTRAQIAREARVSDALVSHHYGNMHALRGALIERAKDGDGPWLGLLAQALTMRDSRATSAPAEVKRSALNTAA